MEASESKCGREYRRTAKRNYGSNSSTCWTSLAAIVAAEGPFKSSSIRLARAQQRPVILPCTISGGSLNGSLTGTRQPGAWHDVWGTKAWEAKRNEDYQQPLFIRAETTNQISCRDSVENRALQECYTHAVTCTYATGYTRRVLGGETYVYMRPCAYTCDLLGC